MNYTFEICANSAESCVAAQQGGAHRVELCASMPEGGTTPSWGEIKLARKLIDIRLHVIIRPRGGDFLYSPLEVDIMEEDIRMAREAGADGVVFGCLTPDGELDMPVMQRLMKAAEGMSVTFHRAFDYVTGGTGCRPHPDFRSAAFRAAGSRAAGPVGEAGCRQNHHHAGLRGERIEHRRAGPKDRCF